MSRWRTIAERALAFLFGSFTVAVMFFWQVVAPHGLRRVSKEARRTGTARPVALVCNSLPRTVLENQTALLAQWTETTELTVGEHPLVGDVYRSLIEVLQGAEHFVFLDVFLFGGSVGLSIGRMLEQLVRERRRTNPAFHVVLMTDPHNYYHVGDECRRVWEALERGGLVTLLEAQLSLLPAGNPINGWLFEQNQRAQALFAHFVGYELNCACRSDHSKIAIVDPGTDRGRLWIGTKNICDAGGGFYRDWAVVFDGDAVEAAGTMYRPDVAAGLARHDELSAEQRQAILSHFRESVPQGSGDVLLCQNSGGELSILPAMLELVESARSSIEMEMLLLSAPPLLRALRTAADRGVRIRCVLDRNEWIRNGLPNRATARRLQHPNIQLRWYDYRSERIPTRTTQLHSKLMVVDRTRAFLGSCNGTTLSFGGIHREIHSGFTLDDRMRDYFVESFERLWAEMPVAGEEPATGLQLVSNWAALTLWHRVH